MLFLGSAKFIKSIIQLFIFKTNSIETKRKISYIQLILFHIVIAFAVFFVGFIGKVYMLGTLGYFFFLVIKKKNRNHEVLMAAAYITGAEVLFRMTGSAFFHELAKYSVMGFLTLGMFYNGIKLKSWPYVLFVLLLFPGIILSALNLDYETNFRKAVLFNISGPLTLFITALYCYSKEISSERLQEVFIVLLMPIITTMVYLFLYTPDISGVVSNTTSNFDTSGGFGPNQVSIVLGIGIFILITRVFKQKNNWYLFIDLVLLALVAFRAITTFSRGGVITAILAVMAYLFLIFLKEKKRFFKIFSRLMILVALGYLTWQYTSKETSGLIDLRYTNKDFMGREKEDASAGRLNIFNAELEAFYENPITGIGIGKVKEYRYKKTGIIAATHNEVSRLISEHGIFGILALLILIITPLSLRISNRTNIYFFACLVFWFLTINHSSMRIAAPAFFYGLCLLKVITDETSETNFLKHKKMVN